jgi:hypothetical protein
LDAGYSKTTDLCDADVVLLMTCAIRDGAEQKVHDRCFGHERFTRGVLLGFTMLYDVISAAAEFMVRVLHSRSGVGIPDGVRVEARPYV